MKNLVIIFLVQLITLYLYGKEAVQWNDNTDVYAQNVPAYIPTDDLVGWWPFNGNANDESGNGHNGIVNGAELTSDRFGNSNSAYRFSDNSISFLNSDFVAFDTISFTCSVWFKYQNIGNSIGNFVRYHDGLSHGGWGVRHMANSRANGLEHNILHNSVTSGNVYNDNAWHNVVFVRNTKSKQLLLYIDGVLQNTTEMESGLINTILKGLPLNFGTCDGFEPFYGSLDDIAIWNRVLSSTEITRVFNSISCRDTILKDTSIVYVSDVFFREISPKVYPENIDSLITTFGGCDSIIEHYTRYEFAENICTDTLYLAVTDTLKINVGLPDFNKGYAIKIYPNPANDHITIEFGSNYPSMEGYTLKIVTLLGQIIYSAPIKSYQTNIDLSTWPGDGIYLVHLMNAQNITVDTRKIVLY